MQLGPAAGYGPLRRWVLKEVRKRGAAGPDDDILITSGVQQAFDLIQRVLASRGETVLMEDPVYPGVRNVFQRGGARVIGIPVGADGIEMAALERTLEKERPRLMVLTPNFQNPTGTTIPEFERAADSRDGAAGGRDGGRERFVWRAAIQRRGCSVDERA